MPTPVQDQQKPAEPVVNPVDNTAAPEAKPDVTIQTSQDEIITRASGFQVDPKPTDNGDKITFDPKMIEQITDPQHKKLVEDAYKSFQADYTKKTTDIASQRKALEAQAEQSSVLSF